MKLCAKLWLSWEGVFPVWIAALVPVAGGITGCTTATSGGGLPGLNDSELVALSDTESVDADLGSGVASVANSVWAVRRINDDSLLFRVRYGENGELLEIFDNVELGQPWVGDRVITDAHGHDTEFAGGRYVAGAYMAAQDAQVGVVVVFHGVFLGLHVGTARAGFSAMLVGDRIEGTFARDIEIFGGTPFDPPSDSEIAIYAEREE